jgi:phospholipase/lecithinase/hemolysin
MPAPLTSLRFAFVAALVVAGACPPLVVSGPYSGLVVFGDSLSDIGNLADATFGLYPGPHYFDDRFSNGPVFVEAMAAGLGLPIAPSTAGGGNFAYGGARTTGTGGLDGLFIRDIEEQVDEFLSTRTADADALFVVLAGSNDLVAGQTNVAEPVNELGNQIQRLVGAGARNFLVGNLPQLGYTPRYNGDPTLLAQMNLRSHDFNTALGTMLDGLGATHPALSVLRLDVAALFSNALNDPGAFGLVNVTLSAAPGLTPGASSYDTNQIAPNANEYLFWDDLHPTATVHAHLAQAALDVLLTLPGDFNADGSVDAADYVAWRDGLGAEYNELDYGVWRANFGRTRGTRGGSIARTAPHSSHLPTVQVPEPTGIVLAAMATALVAICFRRRK